MQNNFQEWFSNKVTISKFPTIEGIQTGLLGNYRYRINVSDLYHPEIDATFKRLGIESFWFPQGEAFGMSLESLYGAMRIMWEAEQHNQPLLLHCHAGRNRSVMVADSYFFLRTQEHRKENQPNLTYAEKSPNRLLLNIDDGQLPGIFKMEEFLDACRETFDDTFADKDRPLDWIKHQMHMRGSGFIA
jgi:protein tyrosine/serine phosphatase